MSTHRIHHPNKNGTTKYDKTHYADSKHRQKRKVVSRRYDVTIQTANHVCELALQEGVPEGRIIDKIMRSYLCNRAQMYEASHR